MISCTNLLLMSNYTFPIRRDSHSKSGNNLFIYNFSGVGADDTFILVKSWTSQHAKALRRSNKNPPSSRCINGISDHNEDELSDVEQSISNHTKDSVYHRKLGEDDLIRIVKATLKHSTLTISVTSITTSVAFFASFISNVTAIKCFRYTYNINHFRRISKQLDSK